MAKTSARSLPALAQALEHQYPGVRVAARVFNSSNSQMQELRFEAPRAILVERGVIEPHGMWGEVFDEFGARMHISLLPNGLAHVQWFDWPDEPDLSRRRSNPDNAKTRALVGKILTRIAKGVPRE